LIVCNCFVPGRVNSACAMKCANVRYGMGLV
jgi:hypothetical protein